MTKVVKVSIGVNKLVQANQPTNKYGDIIFKYITNNVWLLEQCTCSFTHFEVNIGFRLESSLNGVLIHTMLRACFLFIMMDTCIY